MDWLSRGSRRLLLSSVLIVSLVPPQAESSLVRSPSLSNVACGTLTVLTATQAKVIWFIA